jgi:hypothetical protein
LPQYTQAEQRVGVKDALSTAAAAEQLREETRAFGNAAAKLNLQMASAAFLKAKASFASQAEPAKEAAPKGE